MRSSHVAPVLARPSPGSSDKAIGRAASGTKGDRMYRRTHVAASLRRGPDYRLAAKRK
ncbi:MAG TPA: hypothetical protein VK446_13800 [Methylocystis sp.]|nr:hypothetical protein [Methylocystis sp.]